MTLLSVIIPVYNSEDFLSECIDSIVVQNIQGIEIIVVDDGSSGTAKIICQKYQNLGIDLKYIRHKENKGLLCARLTGIANASGLYLTHLDSDDYLNAGLYAHILFELQQGDYTLAMYNVFEHENKQVRDVVFPITGNTQETNAQTILSIIGNSDGNQWLWYVAWNKIWNTDSVKNAWQQLTYHRHLVMLEDVLLSTYLFYQMLEKKHRVLLINNTPGVVYRRHSNSTTKSQLSSRQTLKNLQDVSQVMFFLKSNLEKSDFVLFKIPQLVALLGIKNLPQHGLILKKPFSFIYMHLYFLINIDHKIYINKWIVYLRKIISRP